MNCELSATTCPVKPGFMVIWYILLKRHGVESAHCGLFPRSLRGGACLSKRTGCVVAPNAVVVRNGRMVGAPDPWFEFYGARDERAYVGLAAASDRVLAEAVLRPYAVVPEQSRGGPLAVWAMARQEWRKRYPIEGGPMKGWAERAHAVSWRD